MPKVSDIVLPKVNDLVSDLVLPTLATLYCLQLNGFV